MCDCCPSWLFCCHCGRNSKTEQQRQGSNLTVIFLLFSIAQQQQHGLHHRDSVTHRLFAVSPRAIVSRANARRSTKATMEPLGGPVSESTAWATLHMRKTKVSLRFESTDAGQSYYAFYLADPDLQHEVAAAQFSTIFELRAADGASKFTSICQKWNNGLMHCIWFVSHGSICSMLPMICAAAPQQYLQSTMGFCPLQIWIKKEGWPSWILHESML